MLYPTWALGPMWGVFDPGAFKLDRLVITEWVQAKIAKTNATDLSSGASCLRCRRLAGSPAPSWSSLAQSWCRIWRARQGSWSPCCTGWPRKRARSPRRRGTARGLAASCAGWHPVWVNEQFHFQINNFVDYAHGIFHWNIICFVN